MSQRTPRDAPDVARIAQVRGLLRARQHAPSLREMVGRVAYQAYVVALFGGLYGTVVVRTLGTPSVAPTTGTAAGQAVPAALVGLAVLATLAGARLGTWAGPVLVSRAEAAWLLPAPLDRRRLLRRDLAWGLAGYGAAGGVIGALVGTVVAVETRAGVAGAVLGSILGWVALGVWTGSVALAVESSRRLARAALRGTAVLVLAGAAVVWLSLAAPAVAAWATPWGWATAPAIAAAGVDVPIPWVPVGLLVLAATASVRLAVRRLPGVPDEELVRRAGAAQGVRASAAIFDARAIAQARRSGQRWLVGHRHVRLPRPRHRWQLVVWRDLSSLLRRPGVLERTLVGVAVAAVLVWWADGGTAAIVGATLVVAAAAAQLLEPLRIELEEPVIGDLTPLHPTDVALEHLVVPGLVLAASGIVVAVVAAGIGMLPWAGLPAAVVGTTGLAVVLSAAAGLTSTRGAPPLQWLTTGEYGVLLLVGWLLAGPLLALALVVPGVLVVTEALRDGMAPMTAVARPTVTAVGLAAALAAAMRWRTRRRTEAD